MVEPLRSTQELNFVPTLRRHSWSCTGVVCDFKYVCASSYAYVTSDIVHGDIKPQNVLVFKDNEGSLLPKVADFGYSCLGTGDDDIIRLPISWPWVAPEWHQRGFRIHAAKKMDIYSFGMLCFWVLYRDKLLGHSPDSTAITGQTTPITFTMPQGSGFEQAVLENLKKGDKLRKLAHELISGTKSLSTQRQTALGVFFDSTLC